MPIDGDFRFDLTDGSDLSERLGELDRHLAAPDALRLVFARASLGRWDVLVRFLCEVRGRGVLPLVEVADMGLVSEATLLERYRFLADWDQCTLANVLFAAERWLPDAFQTALEHEARLEARFFREWAAAAVEPRLGRYPALPWRRFLRNVNEENYRFAEACVLAENEPAALTEAVKRILEAKRKTVNLFPKKWGRSKAPAEESLR